MSDRHPLVSVVLPTHDRPERLRRALASVLAQSYRALQVLVVDDASERPVDDVVEAVGGQDRRVQLVRLPTPCGAAAARNRALSRASGDLVAFLDDDDLWKPHKLERQVAFLLDHPSVGIVTSDHEVLDERAAGRILVHRGPSSITARHLLWFNLAGSLSCCVVRRAAAGDDLWLDEDFPSVEDWDLWVRCGRRTGIGVVKEVLARRTLHGDGRLSDPTSKLRGMQAFERRHATTMTPTCLAWLHAHQHMEVGTGWRKRANVLRSVATASPRASALMVLEQSARQLGNLRGDHGLVERVMAAALSAVPSL